MRLITRYSLILLVLSTIPSLLAQQLSPALARRVEVLVRSHIELPPAARVTISAKTPSELPGFDQITATYTTQEQTSAPIPFLISKDGKTLAQFTKFDIAPDPRTLVSEESRPARGGPESAPVQIIGFDDLECPFCARLNASLPAILARYKDQVRIVYRDYPIDEHPWARRAAIDTSCLGKQSAAGYWSSVDAIHLQAAELGSPDRSLAKANASLDTIVRDAGRLQHAQADTLDACIEKQDDTAVKQSQREGLAMGINATPTLFINGARIEGAVPLDFLFEIIDNALLAQGITPPTAPQTLH